MSEVQTVENMVSITIDGVEYRQKRVNISLMLLVPTIYLFLLSVI